MFFQGEHESDHETEEAEMEVIAKSGRWEIGALPQSLRTDGIFLKTRHVTGLGPHLDSLRATSSGDVLTSQHVGIIRQKRGRTAAMVSLAAISSWW